MRHPHKNIRRLRGFGVRVIDSATIRSGEFEEVIEKIRNTLKEPIELPLLYEGDSPRCCSCWKGVVLVRYDMEDRPTSGICVKCGQKFTIRLLLKDHKRSNQSRGKNGKRFRGREALVASSGQGDFFKS